MPAVQATVQAARKVGNHSADQPAASTPGASLAPLVAPVGHRHLDHLLMALAAVMVLDRRAVALEPDLAELAVVPLV